MDNDKNAARKAILASCVVNDVKYWLANEPQTTESLAKLHDRIRDQVAGLPNDPVKTWSDYFPAVSS